MRIDNHCNDLTSQHYSEKQTKKAVNACFLNKQLVSFGIADKTTRDPVLCFYATTVRQIYPDQITSSWPDCDR